ncbi:hypothetical protein [Muricoccus vinaceus]|uniref:Invasion protein B, involved in pathogenesis n=1 Tax=Muricoccus vinaceus TaxID=424704 RepID=A0ABV6IP80_9PROT
MFRPLVILGLLMAAAPAAAQGRPPAPGATEGFGPWLLSCATDRMTDRAECRMLHARPVQPASPGLAPLALEVAERNGRLVPVVTARDLSLEGAARGALALAGTVQLRFPPNRLFDMPCGLEALSLVCAPREADLSRAAAELPLAGGVLVRVGGLLVPDAQAMREPVELSLSDTPAALARFRQRQPEGSAPPPQPAGLLDLRDVLSRLLALFGGP